MEFVYLADRPDAIPTLANWYFNQWGYLNDVSSVDKTVGILQQYLNRDKLPLIILAIENEEVIGAVQLKFYEMDIYPEKEHWLGGVYVSANHRKRNIAGRLVRKALEIAKSHNIETLYLQTEKLDGGLYKPLGWKAIETLEYRGKKVLVMKIQL
ncbi:MAG: GNAT family N-acetyltransferase [Balneolaceae bacterium]|nr:GNAT family N-acetyltransferase [Balneolaceae bacterium]